MAFSTHSVKSIFYPTLGLTFFGSLILAAQYFPQYYDWRYDVMSLLAEPRFNPRAYFIACAGLASSGVLMSFFPALLRARLAAAAPKITRISGWFLYLAAALLTLSGILPGHVAGLGRAHETCAHAYGVAIALAMIGYFCATLRLPGKFRIQRFGGIVLVVIPLSGFVISQLSMIVGYRVDSTADYHALRNALWNSLALWEWIASVGTYLFIGLLLALPETEKKFR